MRTRLLIVLIVSTFVATTSIAAQSKIRRLDGSTIDAAEVDATVTRLMRAAEVTGVSITILNDKRIAYQKAYGLRDKEKNLPLTLDSVMTAASFTKVAFAALVMQLVDEGVIDLDKPVYQYLPKALPEYPSYTDLANDPRYQKITARMLLSHTSGFANLRAFEIDRKLKIHFEPGSRYAYSGEGIELLQFVVETITGRSLTDLMQRRVFEFSGMFRTSMVWQDAFLSDYANGYDEYGRSLGAEQRKTPDAAGSMLTTPRDFARFMLAVMDHRGLSVTTATQMLTPQIQIFSKHQFPTFENASTDANKAIHLSYGLGWGLYSSPYGPAFFKEGHDEGWRNYTVCFPQAGSGIVIMTNSSNGEGIFKELLETLLKNTFTPIEWEGYTPYNQLPPRAPLKQRHIVVVDVKLLDKYAGRYSYPPNVVLTVRREGDHLSVQENDEPKQELVGETDSRFISTVNDDEYSFDLDKNGRVTRLVLHVAGQDIALKRIE